MRDGAATGRRWVLGAAAVTAGLVSVAVGGVTPALAGDVAPPTVTVVYGPPLGNPPATLAAPFVATFSEDVVGVSTDSLRLMRDGVAAPVLATVSCRDAGGLTVDCAGGPVRQARLQPAEPLLLGGFYFVAVNPAGSATVADLGGNPAANVRTGFTRIQNIGGADLSAPQAWGRVADPSARGGSYKRERLAGATYSFSLTGTSLSVHFRTGPDQGTAGVRVSTAVGPLFQAFDGYAAVPGEASLTFTGLPAGVNGVRVTVDGAKNALSSGTWVSVDGYSFTRNATVRSVDSPKATERWATVVVPGEPLAARSGTKGATVSVRSDACPIQVAFATGPDMGKVRVKIGAASSVLDLYRPSVGTLLTENSFASTAVTVTVTVLGTKNALSAGTDVHVRRLWSSCGD